MKRQFPTATVDVHQAKAQFSHPLKRVAAGEEIVIAKGGQPVARLVPFRQSGTRPLGMDAGRVVIAADFDGAMPQAVLTDFER